ncbi:MAG: triose-phosphate isomerase [Deltaproteobacteria bacterium]|nr:triose-phosphate isomerase [Deltaproteobacteria bacterium]
MSDRKPLIAANWKMHKTLEEAVRFVEALQRELGVVQDREVLIAPPFTALASVASVMGTPGFSLGGQNCHWEPQGAFTGEVSAGMLKDAGCRYVLLGHSERRHLFRETDVMIRRKVEAVFREELSPVLCIGEVLEEREEGRTFSVVQEQLEIGIGGIGANLLEHLVIAYEPVWAIGTGKTATPDQAQEVHEFIRRILGSLVDKSVANRTRILYGGSVKPDNVDALMSEPDIDGLLVGGASLQVDSFKRIVQFQTGKA